MKITELLTESSEMVDVFVIYDKTSDQYVRLTYSWGGHSVPASLSDSDYWKGYQSPTWPSWSLAPKVHESGLWKSKATAKKMIERLKAMIDLDVDTLEPREDNIDKNTGEVSSSYIDSWKRLKSKYRKLSKMAQNLDLEIKQIQVPQKMTKIYGLH